MARVRIVMLGAGNMGTAMAHALTGGGHEISARDYFPKVAMDPALNV